MNFMGKIFGPGRTTTGVSGDGSQENEVSQDNSLGLMHLRKLFGEFRHPPANTPQKQLEGRLYSMLPLFCKVSSQTIFTSQGIMILKDFSMNSKGNL